MRAYRLIDADCHTLEPPQMWETWLPKGFHDRAPRLVKDEEGGDAWSFGEGKPLMHIGLVATPGMRFEDIRWKGYTYDTIRRGCFDGKARLEDMDQDGVDAEFLYPSQRTMYHFMGNPDAHFHRAGVQAYNDWLAGEFCAPDPGRLFGLAQMPNLGVDEAVAELRRCKEKGFRGVIITAWPNGGDNLSDRGRPLLRRRPGPRDADQHPHPHRAPEPQGHGAARRAGRDREHGARRHVAVPRGDVRDHDERRPRPLPEAAVPRRRDRRRLDPGLPRAARQLLLAQPRPHRRAHPAAPERVLPRALDLHLHPRSDRHPEPLRHRRAEHGVVDGLPPPRERLALQPQGDRRDVRRCAGAGALRDPGRQHGAHLRPAPGPARCRHERRGGAPPLPRLRHHRRRSLGRRAPRRRPAQGPGRGQRHPALGPGHAEPEPALLRRGLRRREPLRAPRRAPVLLRLHERQPRGRARDPGEHPRHPHAVRRRRVVVLRAAHRARRPHHPRAHAVRLQGHRDEVRRADDVLPRRHHLHQPARRGRGQAALDIDPLPRRGGPPARRLRRLARARLDRGSAPRGRAREVRVLPELPRARPRAPR